MPATSSATFPFFLLKTCFPLARKFPLYVFSPRFLGQSGSSLRESLRLVGFASPESCGVHRETALRHSALPATSSATFPFFLLKICFPLARKFPLYVFSPRFLGQSGPSLRDSLRLVGFASRARAEQLCALAIYTEVNVQVLQAVLLINSCPTLFYFSSIADAAFTFDILTCPQQEFSLSTFILRFFAYRTPCCWCFLSHIQGPSMCARLIALQ